MTLIYTEIEVEVDEIIEAMDGDPSFKFSLIMQIFQCMSQGMMLDDFLDGLESSNTKKLEAIYKVVSILKDKVGTDLGVEADDN